MRPSSTSCADQVAELEDAGRVEPVHRLVEDQQLGVGEQAARDAEALAHAERVGLDLLVGARGEADAGERAVDAVVRGAVAGGRVDVQVLAAGQVGVEARLLDDRADAGERRGAAAGQVVPEQAHRARGRVGEAEQQPDQRGLAGAVGAEEAERDAARHLEVDAVERGAIAEALAEPARLDGECRGGGGGHAAKLRAAWRRVVGRAERAVRAERMNLRRRLIRSDECATNGNCAGWGGG